MHNTRPTHLGFTLLELMITVSIAGILMAIAIPSFKNSIQSNRLTTVANEFVSALNLARSEAIKRGISVTVRQVDQYSYTNLGATANWESGWDIFTDANNDSKYTTGDVLIKTHDALPTSYMLRGNGTTFSNYIRYGSLGQSAGGSFVICDNSDGSGIPKANTSRLITVVTTGRVRVMPDTDTPSDGIPDLGGTTNITSCTPPF